MLSPETQSAVSLIMLSGVFWTRNEQHVYAHKCTKD